MSAQHVLWMTCLASLLGLGLTVLFEQTLQPRPRWSRPLASWCLHVGVWCVIYAMLLTLLERPWFVMGLMLAGVQVVIQVSNAKFRSLNEPFVFHDYEYFTDAIRHPRLYIPFLGWGKFLAICAVVILAAGLALYSEHAPYGQLQWHQRWLFIGGLLAAGAGLCWWGHRHLSQPTLNPVQDMQSLGLMHMLWVYACLERQPLQAGEQPFQRKPLASPAQLPHLVAVQSESFFDPRSLSPLVRPDVLQVFDQVKAEAVASGKLSVPAWGANTVRSEFAFLTGLPEAQLGVHRFNPYHAVMAGAPVASVASYLRDMGYHTVCIHPYWGGFYQRHSVLPKLGFDEFLDIAAFAGAEYHGPYISDLAVAAKIRSLIHAAHKPLFIYAITMENHGPLHLEPVSLHDEQAAFSAPPPAHFRDLTVYLKHLRNADLMMQSLTGFLAAQQRPAGLCWFGDHVPIMPEVYRHCGLPDGNVEYVVWSNRNTAATRVQAVAVDQLASTFLSAMQVF